MGESLDTERRMVRMETQLENINGLLLEIKEDLRNMPYVPRTELQAMFSQRDEKIQRIEEELKTKRTNFIALTAIAISLLSTVINYFK